MNFFFKRHFFLNNFRLRTNFDYFRRTGIDFFSSYIKLRLFTFINNCLFTRLFFRIRNIFHDQITIFIFTGTTFNNTCLRIFSRHFLSRFHFTRLRIHCVSRCSCFLTFFAFLNNVFGSFRQFRIFTNFLFKRNFLFNNFRFRTDFNHFRFTRIFNFTRNI